MELTRKESKVVEHLRHTGIATMSALRKAVDGSHMTVVRALNKYGYHRSVNHNASYYTLGDTPCFNEDGLWLCGDVCFSQQHRLRKALVALAEKAPAGLTVLEAEQRLHTKVGNVLSRLCQQRALKRCFVARRAVYLAVDRERGQQQLGERERQQTPADEDPAAPSNGQGALPGKFDVVTILEALVQMIKTPKSDATQLAKALRMHGVNMTSRQVQGVIDFYAIQKKAALWPSPI